MKTFFGRCSIQKNFSSTISRVVDSLSEYTSEKQRAVLKNSSTMSAHSHFQRHLPILHSLWLELKLIWLGAGLALLTCGTTLQAQLPVSRLYTVSPPGGRAGNAIEVALAGQDLEEVRLLRFSTTNITASQKTNAAGSIEPNRFLVNISSNAAVGRYEVRAVGRFGISNPRTFAVGQFPELTISPTNTSAETALQIEQATIVNGRVEASAFAWFKFSARAGERLLVECMDSQIDSRLDGSLTLHDANKNEIARNRKGGLLDYNVPATGDFFLKLSDFEYRGGPEYFYRLCVSTRPHIDFINPLAGLPGTTNKFTLHGRNLPGGTVATNLTVEGRPLEQLEVEIALPPIEMMRGKQLSTPTELAAVPLDVMEYRIHSTNGISNPVLIGAATAPLVKEEPANNTPESAQKLHPPCEVAGQFYPADDRDWYSFDAKKGDVFWVEIISQRLGVTSDPFALIQKVTKSEKGEEKVADVKELYDSEANFGGPEYRTSSRDPAWKLAVTENGTYRVEVRDLFNRAKSDPRLGYRLSIRKESPGFELVAVPAPNAPPKKDGKDVSLWSMVLRRGQTFPYKILIFRRDNFDGEITLTAEKLPASVTCAPIVVPAGATTATLLFTAATNATDWAGPIEIVGKAKAGQADLTSVSHSASLVWNVADNSLERLEARLNQEVCLSVCSFEPVPVSIVAGEGKWLEAGTNGKVKIPVKVFRNGDFNAALKLKPSGVAALDSMKELDMDSKTPSANLEIDVAKQKLAPGNYYFYLQSQIQGKYQSHAELAKKAAAEAKDAEKAAADQVAALKKAEDALKAASKALSTAEAAGKKADEKLISARTAAEKTDAPAPAQTAKTAAETDAAKAAAKVTSAREARAAAEKAVQEATAKSKTTEANNKAAAARAKELADKSKPKDATVLVYSTPIQLKILARKDK
ncbi:MAG TPA: hypothetical protein VMZ27_11735 [Candidatus Saccharimonadales bacterium]|nr:hypothetical protein [Candidatus Saccharimonadales bacterium]